MPPPIGRPGPRAPGRTCIALARTALAGTLGALARLAAAVEELLRVILLGAASEADRLDALARLAAAALARLLEERLRLAGAGQALVVAELAQAAQGLVDGFVVARLDSNDQEVVLVNW
jgi:hypothetical protein